MTIEELHAEMQAGFKKVEARIRADMKRHEEAIRTHFDLMVEKMQESVKLIAEATAHHAVRLDGHEKRLKRLESSRRT
jgi:type I site-specific restriction endonuclease